MCPVFSRLRGREAHVAMASTDEGHGWQQGHSSGTPSAYCIRPLQSVDLDGISRVHWRACRIAYRFMSWSYTEDEVQRWYAGKLEEWDWGQVACVQDTIVAYRSERRPHRPAVRRSRPPARRPWKRASHSDAGATPAPGDPTRIRGEQACTCVLRAVRVSRS
jgi:hypothetical protein